MDGDPAVDPILDTFSLWLPLPYRVAIISVFGIWAWGANLHYLSLVKIDVPSLIRYPARTHSHQPRHHVSTYRLATLLSIPLAISLLLFWVLTRGHANLVEQYSLLPNLYLIVVILVFALPLPSVSPSGRSRFLLTLRRISIGGIAEADNGKFGDILMADALTSYAKVMGDLFVALCMFVSGKGSSTSRPDRTCGGAFLVPFIISIPSLIRLRQCLIEYLRVRRANKPSGSIGAAGWGGQHLANALKYSTAFPVIILSAMQRGYDPATFHMSEKGLFRLWLLAVFINSFYSFYWDVAKDWDLTLFSKERDNPEHPFGLRRHRYFYAKELYYSVIIMDLMLRCTWSFKLSPHLDHFNDLEGGIFLMEALEVFRRWVWIFFRVETEWVRNNRGPAPDDILLGDYDTNKYDSD
ncbi:EXS-domain-containing protein [Pseudovirgaria hyperparasitica]|uniref:EXS-domain-containing protein n=1 Tax=Pseudovirgaria hyperparasitica TaxID=470096 RepID=A0A6A6WBD2_9PEZI|nr:EXS-domain-containing protein [Pseudovirgaria hyperparasitica]KAF2759270.1 EXS-domain-containing protein [Pseudovirgaria hyperparasitica]